MGAKGARYFACPVVASAPSVRPWNEFAIMSKRVFVFPVCARACARAILIAHSHASVPLLQKNARPNPESVVSRAASGAWYSWKNRLETWIRRDACAVMAAWMAGWP